MTRNWWYRASLLLFLIVISVMAVVPTVFNFKDDSSFPVKSKIALGLDLQGGLYMVLGIDFRKVYRDEVRNYISKVKSTLEDEGIASELGDLVATNVDDPRHTIVISDPSKVDAAKSKIKEFFDYPLRLTHAEGTTLEYGLGRQYVQEIEENSVKKSIEVIRNRIDEFGVTEPEIVSQGNDRIVVQLPGVKDIERAKELIGKTAKLEFKMVSEEVPLATMQGWMDEAEKAGITYKRGALFSQYVHAINEKFKDKMPKGHELAFRKTLNKNSNEIENLVPYMVEATAQLTGDLLQDATVRIDQQNNQPYVGITFKSQGAKLFEEITGANVNRRLAIILDGNVYSDPVIQTRIAGGNAQITLGAGNYNTVLQEARDLSLVLRAGALPVELEFQEQRIVGPSLGKDAIDSSIVASGIACVLLFLFIIWYYKLSGIFAVTTLVLNVMFILACLVGLEATLTLPGIAGIALTVGMAVDANIIIYERIKEEIHFKGTPVREAVELGFDRAFWTILDANLTTAAAGFMLLNFGTGPIRGFAVTLLIGIVATVYTAYFVSRVMFEWYIQKNSGQKLSI